MLEILKKAGLSASIAIILVLAITAIPIWYQIETTKSQNSKIQMLEEAVEVLQAVK